MSGFPLYDNLYKEIKTKKDLSIKEKELFVSDIKKIDDTGKELIYALICFYYLDHNDVDIINEVPYNSINELNIDGTSNLSFVFTAFPKKLRRLLYNFLRLHEQK